MTFLKYQKYNPEFLNNYLKYKRYITFGAETTVVEEYLDLRTFFRYVKLASSNKDMESITIEEFRQIEIKTVTLEDISEVVPSTINSFLYFLNYTLNNSPQARNRKLSSLKNFYEYLFINNFVTYNPTLNIKTATLQKREAKYLSLDESKKMLSKTINSKQRFKIRNYAIICLFLNCSIRLSELINIDLIDLKLDEKTLKIKGKGNIERIIYLDDAACEAIEEYLKFRPNLTRENPDYNALFISEQDKRISKRSVQYIIEQSLYMTLGEKKSGFHTHSLRHTSATLMYDENNTDILVIKKILGHKTLSATERYTHVSGKKMKEIMEKCTISSILERGGNK